MKAWPAVCGVLGLASAVLWLVGQTGLAPAQGVATLAWDPGQWTQRPWTLWTASLVHLSGAHLLANLLALGALAGLGWALRANAAAAGAVLLAWPLGTVSLLCWPELGRYAGLSGLNHAVAAVLWTYLAIYSVAKPVSFVLFSALMLKLLVEHAWSQPVMFEAGWGFNVVVAAHLTGALAGVLCGLLVGGVSRVGTPAFVKR